jgi:hypothetical protein
MRLLHVPRMRRGEPIIQDESITVRALVGQANCQLPLARCSPGPAFAYDSMHFLFSVTASI